MRSLKSTSNTRCRYAGCFALGFVAASLSLAIMLWIMWCYMGLSIVQISDAQRRGVVNFSYTTPKPATPSGPANRTEEEGALESSLNSIPKSLVTPPSQPRRRGESSSSIESAKGDFATRTQGGDSPNSAKRESVTASVTSLSDKVEGSILHEREKEVLHPRKVSTSNTENRNKEENLPEIKPTQTYAPAQSDPLPVDPKDDRQISRDLDRKDELSGSRRSYRDPDFDRDPPPRRYETGRRRYDDDDYDDRGSPSRYDKRERGRDTDDRYSKGDTRVYPDERPRLDRYPPRDDERRRGDDRDYEDGYRDKDDRYRVREDRYRDRDDRYRDDDDRHRSRDDGYRYRDDLSEYDDKYKNDKRYLDDERNRRKDDRLGYDDKYGSRDDRYPPRNERYPDDRIRDRPYDDRRDRVIPRDDEDRSRERDYRNPIVSSRTDIPDRRPDDTRRPSDYDIPVQNRPRTSYKDESRTVDRSRDDESKYDDRERIYPTRTRDEAYVPRSTIPLPLSRDGAYDSGTSRIGERRRDEDRYSSRRDKPKYDDDDRRVDESRYISSSSVRESGSTRRDLSRDDYSTRLPGDKKLDDVDLERRPYSAEEEERLKNSRTKYYDEGDRKPSDDSRLNYRTDDDYLRPTRTEDYDRSRSRPRGDYDADRSRSGDWYDRPIDDRPSRRYRSEYDELRRRGDAGLRKDSYSRDVTDDERTMLRRPEGRSPADDRRYDDDIPPRRTKYDDDDIPPRRTRYDERPPRHDVDRDREDRRRYRNDKYPEDDGRFKDLPSSNIEDSSRNVPLRSEKRETFAGSSTSPRDVVVPEKRYSNSERPISDSGKDEERPINAKDVIEAALKHSDAPNRNSKEVFYPAFEPRLLNSNRTDFIPLSDRKGITRSRRSPIYLHFLHII